MNDMLKQTDVILIGAGVMSATLGSLLKELTPEWDIQVFEKLGGAGEESSNEWNNAGTGHAALCELNYTSEKADGSVDVSKAIKVNEQFQLSRQYWSYLVRQNVIERAQDFIMPIPHISLVEGEANVTFLKKRLEALSNHPLFAGMEFSEDDETLARWMPLIMEGRTGDTPIAATKIDTGTDVNFGALTRMLFEHLEQQQVAVHYGHQVERLKKAADGLWHVTVRNLTNGQRDVYATKFVFIGAGGGSLSLLQKTGIPESKQIGGFPVSGLFLACDNPDVVERHHAKVYGKAKVGAPPMSVPHLDTRYIDGKKTLLFGPFAGFTPKFLKQGSNLDLIKSVKPNNLITMLAAGAKEMALTKYLVEQLLLSQEQRMEELREFMPKAKAEDWRMIVAGQRVQVIKDTQAGRGTLQFGTEVVSSEDGTVAALLGASPGASTAVHVMLEVLEKCFPEKMETWSDKIREMIPSYGVMLSDHPELFKEIQEETSRTLGLHEGVKSHQKQTCQV